MGRTRANPVFIDPLHLASENPRPASSNPADLYTGRGQAILDKRETIKHQIIEQRRLQHQKAVAISLSLAKPVFGCEPARKTIAFGIRKHASKAVASRDLNTACAASAPAWIVSHQRRPPTASSIRLRSRLSILTVSISSGGGPETGVPVPASSSVPSLVLI